MVMPQSVWEERRVYNVNGWEGRLLERTSVGRGGIDCWLSSQVSLSFLPGHLVGQPPLRQSVATEDEVKWIATFGSLA